MSVLSPADLDFFDENGYVIVPRVISAERAALTAAAVWEFAGADANDPESWYSEERPGIMVETCPVKPRTQRSPVGRRQRPYRRQRPGAAVGIDGETREAYGREPGGQAVGHSLSVDIVIQIAHRHHGELIIAQMGDIALELIGIGVDQGVVEIGDAVEGEYRDAPVAGLV